MKTAQWFLLSGLLILFLFKGLQPAFSQIGTDFANYYTASWIAVHDRGETIRLYDPSWFALKARELGEAQGAIFRPFPPPTALLMIPLTAFSMGVAKDIWTVMNVLILAALVILFRSFCKGNLPAAAIILLGTGWGVVNDVYLGQVYLLILLCLALSIYLFVRGRDIMAGLLAGLFVPVKYFPFCLVVLFLIEKRWRAAWSALAAAAFVILASIFVLGWNLHAEFLTSVFASHMDGQMANPFALSYQSWNSLLRTLFIKDQFLNPNPLVDWVDGFSAVRLLIMVAVVSTLVVAIRRDLVSAPGVGSRLALLFVATLLLSPASASYHMLILALPAAAIWPELWNDSNRRTSMILSVSYLLLGLIPVAALERLSLEGGWRLLGYPRLFLLMVIFLSLVRLVAARRQHTVPEAV
ncbi:MAG: hypothetical protein A2X66_01350 [Ignavibacteria bacterium GWA2_54_16]|nr:MAG: hypothetical protein A2X66_01350 [Ignavibacteria bacterium GWA2_54_16]